MDATGAPAVAGGVSRRSAFAGFASIGIHGTALVIATLILRDHVGEPPSVELTPIQVVEAPPPPPPPVASEPGTPLPSPSNSSTGTLGRRGHDAPQRSQTRAPATTDPYADLRVSYEKPTGPEPGNEAGTTGPGLGAGLHGEGTGRGDGTGQFGLGNLPLPAPPASLARGPRPKADYRHWNFRADRRFAGAIVRVELSIDPQGRVRNVRVLQGVEDDIDQQATEFARRFEFYPALDNAGKAIWGRHPWEFVLLGNNIDFAIERF